VRSGCAVRNGRGDGGSQVPLANCGAAANIPQLQICFILFFCFFLW
jgi:hypothetical protein